MTVLQRYQSRFDGAAGWCRRPDLLGTVRPVFAALGAGIAMSGSR